MHLRVLVHHKILHQLVRIVFTTLPFARGTIWKQKTKKYQNFTICSFIHSLENGSNDCSVNRETEPPKVGHKKSKSVKYCYADADLFAFKSNTNCVMQGLYTVWATDMLARRLLYFLWPYWTCSAGICSYSPTSDCSRVGEKHKITHTNAHKQEHKESHYSCSHSLKYIQYI